MIRKTKNVLVALMLALFTLQSYGCGTLFYPERRGQTGGRIDPGVAILDGIGVLFFIIPGLIAYAIDFSTGAIYIPRGHRSMATPEVMVVRVSPSELTGVKVAEVVAAETGISPAEMRRARVMRLESAEEIPARLAEAWRDGCRR